MPPYFKCVPCKIRVSASGGRTGLTDEACPSCGRALEPVSKLTDVVGFRSPDLLDPSLPPRVAEPVADVSGGRPVAEAQVELDRWLDEGGSLGREPLAQAAVVFVQSDRLAVKDPELRSATADVQRRLPQVPSAGGASPPDAH